MDPTESLLSAWRANPGAERAGALCRVLGSRAGDSPEHRRVLAEVAPQIKSRHAGDVAVQLELARACIAARDMFLSDGVLKPLLQVAPNEPQVWRLLGEVFLRAGNAKDAETAFEGAIARGLRDSDTMRWHEKARGCRNLQDSGGHPAVAAEVLRWTESWGGRGGHDARLVDPRGAASAPEPRLVDSRGHVGAASGPEPRLVDSRGHVGAASGPEPRLVDSPDSQRTVIREPPPTDFDATIIRGPMAADLALGDKAPDSERTAFYVKPEVPFALDDTAKEPGPAPGKASFPQAPPLAAPLPKAAPPRASQHVGAIHPAGDASASRSADTSGDKSLLDEESMDVDVLKLPEGDKLDEMLEALRKSEGLVIEEPTGFYQAPQLPLPGDAPAKGAAKDDILALAQQGKLPNVSTFGTMMMTPGAGASTPNYPLPPPPPINSPDAPTGPSRRIAASVESPSGVIINASSGDADAMAPTARPDAFMFGADGPAGMLVAGPPGQTLGAAPALPLGPGPKATTVRPPKPKSRTSLYVVLFLLLALAGGAYYAIRVRGLISIGAAEPVAPAAAVEA